LSCLWKWAACLDAQVKGFFMSLFIASTGLIMSPRFLAAHLPVLAAGMFLVVLGKSILVRFAFSQPGHHVGIMMASCRSCNTVKGILVQALRVLSRVA
jgi:predicted Kef-type K+ transport protein